MRGKGGAKACGGEGVGRHEGKLGEEISRNLAEGGVMGDSLDPNPSFTTPKSTPPTPNHLQR